jgi:hypothetical protein
MHRGKFLGRNLTYLHVPGQYYRFAESADGENWSERLSRPEMTLCWGSRVNAARIYPPKGDSASAWTHQVATLTLFDTSVSGLGSDVKR